MLLKHPPALPDQPSPRHTSPFRSPIALLSYHPNPTHDSSAARRTLYAGVSPCRCLVTAVAGLLGSVLPAELSWLLIDQAASGRWSLWTASQRSGVVAAAWEMPGRRPCRASPAGVHHWVSTHSVPTSGSGRPAVRCPAVRCPVSWFRRPGSGRPVSARPASGRLVSARPPNHLRLVRVSPAVALETTSVRRATFTKGRIQLQVVCGVPSGLVDRPSRPRGRRRWGDRWGSGRGPGRVRPGRRLRPRSTADRPGQASPA
jgi:hypothetical protein